MQGTTAIRHRIKKKACRKEILLLFYFDTPSAYLNQPADYIGTIVNPHLYSRLAGIKY